MANFPSFTFTAAGRAAITRSLSGKGVDRLIITKCVLGDGVYSGSIDTLIDVTSPKMTVTVSEYTDNGDGTSVTRFVYDNASLDVGFYHREMGIYAKNGDSGTELLLCYSNAGDQYSYIKAGTVDSVTKQRKATIPPQTFKFVLATGGSGSVNAVIDPKGYVDVAMLNAHNTDPTAHPDIRQKLNSYLPLTGGTVTGPILYGKTPSNDSELINKAYADKKYILDLSALDENTFYPVVFAETNYGVEAEIHSRRKPSSAPYNQNMLSFRIDAGGWSDSETSITIKNYYLYDSKEITIGCVAVGTHGGGVFVWLRGGSPSPYAIISTVPPQLFANGWSGFNEQVATVGLTYHGAETGNANLNIIFNPLDIPSGSAKNFNYTTYGTFEKAIADADGRVIKDTYLNKAGDTVTGELNVPTQATTDNSTKVANTAFVQSAVANNVAKLVNSAPSTLDTLNELANALGNDPNFATTVATQIGQKADRTDLKDIKNLLGFGGIVAQRLETNGYVKFANGFTIQWGNSTSPIRYPIEFSENPINLLFHKTALNRKTIVVSGACDTKLQYFDLYDVADAAFYTNNPPVNYVAFGKS